MTKPATVKMPAVEHDDKSTSSGGKAATPKSETFAAGSWVIRMDQPYSRAADALLDRQYWSPEDPQKHPYDDTGWSFGDLFNVRTVRVTDQSILSSKIERVTALRADSPENQSAHASLYAVNNSGQISLLALVFALQPAEVSVSEEAFETGGRHFNSGSLLIRRPDEVKLHDALTELDLQAHVLNAQPHVRFHQAAAPRIAFMHTWLYTQTEGWWRQAFDRLKVPYAYVSTQTVGRATDLRSQYDVIIFAPVAHVSTQQIVNGIPMWGNPLPWQKTTLTPNLGKLDETSDMRPGLGLDGVAHLKEFVEKGGLLITAEDTSQFAIDQGLAPGVFVASLKGTKVEGSVLRAVALDKNQPVSYGYTGEMAVYSQNGMAFTVSNLVTNRDILTEKEYKRPTGRGGPDDEDAPEGRPYEEASPLPSPKPWEATPLNEEQARNNVLLIPVELRPQVIFRFAEKKRLLASVLLDGGDSIAERPIVVDAHLGKGNVLLFANNPIYRGETLGSYAMVFNAILNFGNLSARK